MKNIYQHKHITNRKAKEALNGQKGCVIWFTGLPGSGKSTIANALEVVLFKKSCSTIILDGDNIRSGLNSDLGFSKADREENIRRIGEVAKLLAENGQIAIVSFVSPYRKNRNKARSILRKSDFIEVYIKCGVEECARRDPKGLYSKAGAGKIKNFTGISHPYESPFHPEITIDTETMSISQSADTILKYLSKKGYIK